MISGKSKTNLLCDSILFHYFFYCFLIDGSGPSTDAEL